MSIVEVDLLVVDDDDDVQRHYRAGVVSRMGWNGISGVLRTYRFPYGGIAEL